MFRGIPEISEFLGDIRGPVGDAFEEIVAEFRRFWFVRG
jgi:hypothetical protein